MCVHILAGINYGRRADRARHAQPGSHNVRAHQIACARARVEKSSRAHAIAHVCRWCRCKCLAIDFVRMRPIYGAGRVCDITCARIDSLSFSILNNSLARALTEKRVERRCAQPTIAISAAPRCACRRQKCKCVHRRDTINTLRVRRQRRQRRGDENCAHTIMQNRTHVRRDSTQRQHKQTKQVSPVPAGAGAQCIC